jgi:hypothetical protein
MISTQPDATSVRLRMLAMCSLLVLSIAGQASAQPASSQEPIAFIGHGALFGPDGSEIAPTVKFIDRATGWYIEELKKGLSAAQRTEFDAMQSSMTQGLPDEQSKLIVNTQLIDWLLDRSTRNDVDRLRGKNRLLKAILQKRLSDQSSIRFPRGTEKFNPTVEVLKRIGEIQKSKKPSVFSSTINGGEAYRAECAAAGVPLPPDFGPGSAWVSQGVIPKDELYIVRSNDAEVLTWTSTSPKGLCIALPRYDIDKQVQADGIICMGVDTSKVCFWDNQVLNSDEPFMFPLGSAQPISRWLGGADLRASVGGVCSDCHAGENPYIIHGKLLQSLAERLPTFPNSWYNPLVRTGDTDPWPENPGPMASSSPSCKDCHEPSYAGRLPQLSKKVASYCGILRASIGALAPRPPGELNGPPSMPMGRKAGTLACTPALTPADPRYRPCSAEATFDCTPTFADTDPRREAPDFPAAYKVHCTKEMSELLKQCDNP